MTLSLPSLEDTSCTPTLPRCVCTLCSLFLLSNFYTPLQSYPREARTAIQTSEIVSLNSRQTGTEKDRWNLIKGGFMKYGKVQSKHTQLFTVTVNSSHLCLMRKVIQSTLLLLPLITLGGILPGVSSCTPTLPKF